MKKLLLAATYLMLSSAVHAQTGIGTTTPDSSAVLEHQHRLFKRLCHPVRILRSLNSSWFA